MKSRPILFGALACAVAGNAFAYDVLGDWPTKFKTDSGYEFGTKGIYRGDINDFSNGGVDPATDAPLFEDATTWRDKEFDLYAKTPSGFGIDAGYDFQTKAWVDNYLSYSSDAIGKIRLGQFKTPVGWEQGEESLNATTFLERSLPILAISTSRRIGVDWTYTGIPKWTVALAYFSGGDLNGGNNGHGPAVHVVFNPIKQKGEVIHLGFAASRESREATTDGRGVTSPPSAQFSADPEAGLTDTQLVDSGKLKNVGDIDRFGLEAAWIHGPLLLQGEYLRFNADRTDGLPSYSGDGYYALGAWMLTGESREYTDGAVGNVKPEHKYGAIEIAARYSELDLNDAPVLGGRERDWTLGVNWYIGQHLKVQANYVRAKADDSPANSYLAQIDPRIVELRAQIYF